MGYSTQAIGQESFAAGHCSNATGDYSFSLGYWTHSEGEASITFGIKTLSEGVASIAMGQSTTATGNYSMAIGNGSEANKVGALVSGNHTISNSEYNLIAGCYNIGRDYTALEIGIGTSLTERKNAIDVYCDGRIHAPELSIDLIDDDTANLSDRTLVTREYLLQYGGGSFTQYTFTATEDQTIFVLEGVASEMIRIFSDGIKARDTEYIITPDLTNNKTTIEFYIGRQLNEEVIFEVYTKIRNEVDFDAAEDQRIFVVPNSVFMAAEIHVDGALVQKNKYVITNDGTNTTITFEEGLRKNIWVHISY
jgi:hypothetical protein